MENKVKMLSPEQISESLLELLEYSDSVPLVVSGNSMLPFLIHERDVVYLSKIKKPLKKGDIVFYRRDSGAYVLHRICDSDGSVFSLVGDAQTTIERNIRRDQLLAVVCAVRRNGKIIKEGNIWWSFFEKFWLRIIPLRKKLVRVYLFLAHRS